MTTPAPLPVTVAEIDALLERLVAHWHTVEPAHEEDGLSGKICDLHRFNFLLWHEEDIARSPDVTDAKIAQVKRAIDGYNQARNDAIEKVDDWLIEELARRGVVAASGAPAATETPGADGDFLDDINPESLTVTTGAMLEPALRDAKPGEPIQFERQGYFCADPDSTADKPVFNRTVALRDSYAKIGG